MTFRLWTGEVAGYTLAPFPMIPRRMRRQVKTFVVLFGLLLAGNCWALPEGNSIEFSNCMLSLPGSPATARAECGFIEVPENPDDPNGRKISIHVALAQATSLEAREDPVFFFAGGPGQAASETWVMIRNTLDMIRKNRDIVMIDQRGTGQSNKLDCLPDEVEDLNAELDLGKLAEMTAGCLEELDADTRFYTTTIAMGDFNRVREAMGYEQVNLVGVSYGTRAAQVYLREFPESVRSVTLDSVVPMQLALGQEHAVMLDLAVGRVFADCRAEPSCAERFTGDLERLNALVAELRAEPRWITFTDPITGQDHDLRMTAETLAVAIRFLSYSSETQATLPLLVHEALETGRLDRLAAQAALVMGGMTEMIARGMELSVMCSEDFPYMDANQDNSDTLLGNVFLSAVKAQCEVWPRGEVSPAFHDPVISDVPVLLMSGERDPVTPPNYAAMAAETFSNSLELVARGQSHSVMKHVCLKNVTTQFIDAGTVQDLDTECVDRIRPAPFFTSLLGPEP